MQNNRVKRDVLRLKRLIQCFARGRFVCVLRSIYRYMLSPSAFYKKTIESVDFYKRFVEFANGSCARIKRKHQNNHYRLMPPRGGQTRRVMPKKCHCEEKLCFDAAIQCALVNSGAQQMDRHRRCAPSR